ncbi:MAG: hypothetical protein ABJY39_15680 [Alphaproteobacteria bacterium]
MAVDWPATIHGESSRAANIFSQAMRSTPFKIDSLLWQRLNLTWPGIRPLQRRYDAPAKRFSDRTGIAATARLWFLNRRLAGKFSFQQKQEHGALIERDFHIVAGLSNLGISIGFT